MTKKGNEWINAEVLRLVEKELRSLADRCKFLREQLGEKSVAVEGLAGTNRFKERVVAFLAKVQRKLETPLPINAAEPPAEYQVKAKPKKKAATRKKSSADLRNQS